MSTAPPLESRVAHLESALAISPPSTAATADAGELARVTKALERAQYRLSHLERAYDALAARASSAEAEVVKLRGSPPSS